MIMRKAEKPIVNRLKKLQKAIVGYLVRIRFYRRKDVDNMTCNYFEYREIMDKMFYGVALTDSHLNNVTEQIRRYIVNGGAGNVLKALGIGIKIITKEAILLPDEIVYRRFVWLDGGRNGEELHRNEIENIGMFLKHGAFYGKCGVLVY